MTGYLQFLGVLSLTLFVALLLLVWGYVCMYWIAEMKGHMLSLTERLKGRYPD